MNTVKTQKNLQVAVGYCRVSTDDQADNGISLDYQEEQCRNTARSDGYTEIIIIRDEGKSGKNLKRKGIQEVMKLAENKEISIVYVTNSDRLARNIKDHQDLRSLFRSNNVDLKYLNGQASDDGATSTMADNMFASFNQYHSDNTREKTKQAIDAKAKAGYFPTCAPVGYQNTVNPDKLCEKVAAKIIIPHPKTGHLVTEAFKLFASGEYNVFKLNTIMFEKGLVSNSDKKLAPSMMYNMFRNRLYLGEIHWRDIHIQGQHTPLIDEETFNRVQNILADHGDNRCRRRKFFWLLAGYLFCPIHNRRYTAEWHLGKSKAYYHCSNAKGCGKYAEKNDLEKQVAQKFKYLEFNPTFVETVVAKVKGIFEERRDKFLTDQRVFINQKNAWQKKLEVAEERLLDDTLEKPDYMRIKEEVTNDILRIDRQLNNLKKSHETSIEPITEILNFTKNIYATYMKAPEQLQKKLLGFFFDGFDVENGVILSSRYSLLFQSLIELNALSDKSVNNKKPFENKADSSVILSSDWGAYRELNPNRRFHKPQC